ncbi:acyl-CoA dehydrogenase family protein [Sphingobium sp. TKS]|uniref:acyl-CoA dehydrogenase family protein n=1 Tax=Sphingobium sp. TKS TaxID=1315974 RepID=UPI000770369E|nr:acyl-CoA dehydrogenase family protein [Sphingobium sp. TKS]AMK24150.1 acyl-CoA dehydrogenase [Sphingobium sp. TKS]
MHFDLTDEQKQFADAIERLLADKLSGNILTRIDEIPSVTAALDAELSALGVPAILTDQSHGGLGMGLLTLSVVAEALGRHAAPTSHIRNAVGAWIVAECGSERVKNLWLDRLLAGDAKVAFAFSETSDIWSPDEWRMTSAHDEVTKRCVEGASDADLFIIGLEDGLFAVPKEAAQAHVSDYPPLDASRPHASVTLQMAGAEAVGDRQAAWRLYDALMILAAIDAAGAGSAALELSVEYAKSRVQFGRPIGAFQAIKHALANMAVDMDPVRYFCWFAAHAWDTPAPEAPWSAALAKAHATDVAVKTARAAVEAHGGIGYTWEYPLHLLLKRAMHDRMTLSSSNRLRARAATLPRPLT